MAYKRRRRLVWGVVLLSGINGCGVWNAYWETGRPQPPPGDWEQLLAGTWRVCHPANLVGNVELRFDAENSFTLVGSDRIGPAFKELYSYEVSPSPVNAAILDGCYATDTIGCRVYQCEGSEFWRDRDPPNLAQGRVSLLSDLGNAYVFAASVRGEFELHMDFALDRDIHEHRYVVFRKVQ